MKSLVNKYFIELVIFFDFASFPQFISPEMNSVLELKGGGGGNIIT